MPTLNELNGLPPAAARDFFFGICGSSRWAEAMAGCGPFWDVNVVFNAADIIWECLSDEDRREALRNRPGGEPSEPSPSLTEALRAYEEKFGYGFNLPGFDGGADEFEQTLRRRLDYPPKAEFELAVSGEAVAMRRELRRRLAG